LLREESEGYSKLLTELNQEITEKLSPEAVLQNIKSLIGRYRNKYIHETLDSETKTYNSYSHSSNL